jgi:hypothetical protein
MFSDELDWPRPAFVVGFLAVDGFVFFTVVLGFDAGSSA